MRRRRVLSWCIFLPSRRGGDLVLAELRGGIPSRWVCASSNPWYAYLYRRVNRTRGYRDTIRGCLVAHPLITERESLIIDVAVHSQSSVKVLCARDTSGTLLQVSSGMRSFNYTATVARDINSNIRVGKRARNGCIFSLCPFLFKKKIFLVCEERKDVALKGKSWINDLITGSVPNTGISTLYKCFFLNKL